MLSEIIAMFSDANTQWVLTGTLLLGIASGVIGSFALLRKQSLIGDAMAHAALPGVCVAFLLFGQKSMPLFLVSAAIAGLIATYCIQMITKHSRIKEDTAIGLILSVFFGFGIVLLTRIAQSPSGNKSGLDDFIFGQAASMVGSDVKIIAGSAAVLLLITFVLFKEFKLLTFDQTFASGIGLPVKWLNGLLMCLIVGSVVIGIQTVGVVLMSAMLITPAIAARYWTEKLHVMVILSGAIGGISGVFGTILSTTAEKIATGPIIVIAATIIFLFSLLFAPKRGLLFKWLRLVRVQSRTAQEQLLVSLYECYEEAGKAGVQSFSITAVMKRRPIKKMLVSSVLNKLKKRELITREGEQIALTARGLQEAYTMTLNHRLHEIFMMHEKEFVLPQLENDTFDVTKLPAQTIKQLKEKLAYYGREPGVGYQFEQRRELKA